jgi:uncharacterized membrane protein
MNALLWLAVIVGGVVLHRLYSRLRDTEQSLLDAWREIGRLEDLVKLPAVGAPAPAEPEPEPAPEARPVEPVEVPATEAPVTVPPPLVHRGSPSAERPREATTPSESTPTTLALPARKPPISIDWERWVGVRGAAVLGGVVLALAAILFLKYSIEHGLIPPIVRVALGFLAGAGSIVGSEVMRRRRYGVTADAVAGSGVVMLYAAVWAARVLYGLIPSVLAWVLMVLVTLVCGLLSWRRESLVIAVLGLTGGFITPLLLTSGSFDPIGLFGYVLLLDVGLLWLASRRRWPILIALSLGGTFLYQAVWVFFDHMSPAHFPLTLGMLGLFALLFAFTSRRGTREEDQAPGGFDRLARAGGVLLPFLFALHFAARADLGRHLAAVAALLTLLSLAAVWLGRAHAASSGERVAWLPLAAAAADVGVVAIWVARTRLTPALAWELAAVSTVLALAFHWPLELDRRRGLSRDGWRPAALVVGGLAVLVVFGRLAPVPAVFWPWLAGWLVLMVLWLRQAAIVPLPRLRLAAAGLAAVALTSFLAGHGGEASMPPVELFLGLMVLITAAFQLLGMRDRAPRQLDADAPDAAAALAALGSGFGLVVMVGYPGFGAGYFFAATLALGLLAVFAATRLGSGAVYLAAAAVVVIAQTAWASGAGRLDGERAAAVVLAGCAISVLIVTFWPFLAGGKLATERLTLYTAALAGPAWFPALRRAYERLFGDGLIAILPLALGVVALTAALRGRRYWDPAAAAHKRSLTWFLAVTLGFVSLAIPLQLDKEWVTLGWALQGLAVMALWKRLDHPGLRYLGLALLAAVTVRLVANPALLGYYQRSGVPVFNWLMYTYLVPAAALLWSARIQEPLEVGRRPPREGSLYAGPQPLGAAACGIAAIMVVFVWINLTIVDAFSRGPELSMSLERMPARDLTLSLAWTLFAVLLLAIGMARRSVALRWISLAFLVLAIGKVFLYDLGELRELYRVASLVGLAISLLLVSLAYQRFVFADDRGKPDRKEAPEEE